MRCDDAPYADGSCAIAEADFLETYLVNETMAAIDARIAPADDATATAVAAPLFVPSRSSRRTRRRRRRRRGAARPPTPAGRSPP